MVGLVVPSPTSRGKDEVSFLPREKYIVVAFVQEEAHDLAKFRMSMIHRFMTSHPVAEFARGTKMDARCYLVSSLFLPTG